MRLGEYEARFLPALSGIRKSIAAKDNNNQTTLIKKGAATGSTRGTLNGVQRIKLAGWRDLGPGKREVSITADWGIMSEHRWEPFSLPGDNGSFVLDPVTGELAGLLFTASEDGERDFRPTADFIPARVLFDDIMRITGASDVRLPLSWEE